MQICEFAWSLHSISKGRIGVKLEFKWYHLQNHRHFNAPFHCSANKFFNKFHFIFFEKKILYAKWAHTLEWLFCKPWQIVSIQITFSKVVLNWCCHRENEWLVYSSQPTILFGHYIFYFYSSIQSLMVIINPSGPCVDNVMILNLNNNDKN